jgi:putative intracellular protease/amidase
MNILMVLTSHDRLGNTGKPTGFWLEEFAAPYYVFTDAGAHVTLASPAGGEPPTDPASDEAAAQTDATRRFKADPAAQAALATTHTLHGLQAGDFDALFYPGGHGPLWDLADDPRSIALIETMLAAGKPVAAVCHAPGVLRHAKTVAGAPVVQGREVTGFANSEERAAGLADVVPFLVEDMLAAQGGHYSKAADWQPFVVADRELITGQNPASSAPAARALLERLNEARADAALQGEGNVDAARRHRGAVEAFVASGQVEDAARAAEPSTPVDEMEMFEAERIGESHSKGEDQGPEPTPPRAR